MQRDTCENEGKSREKRHASQMPGYRRLGVSRVAQRWRTPFLGRKSTSTLLDGDCPEDGATCPTMERKVATGTAGTDVEAVTRNSPHPTHSWGDRWEDRASEGFGDRLQSLFLSVIQGDNLKTEATSESV